MICSNLSRGLLALVLIGLQLFVFAGQASAYSLTVDQIICDQVATPGCSGLSGTINVTKSWNTLTFTITNTSTSPVAGSAALLTGWGGTLGALDRNILSGSVSLNGATAVNGATTNLTTLQNLWGFNNVAHGPLASQVSQPLGFGVGTLQSILNGNPTGLTFKEMQGNVQGPNHGLLATGGNSGGLPAYRNSLKFYLNVNGSIGTLSSLNSQWWALAFASPQAAVPIPGTTLLFAVSFAGFVAWRWRDERRSRA